MSYSFPTISDGVKILVNGVVQALCTSEYNAKRTLASKYALKDLGIGPDDDVDVVYWEQGSDAYGSPYSVEKTLWSGCGWSIIDFT